MKAVLVDRHHADLFYGLQRLFEDRLNCRVYTPIGFDWFDAGVWQFGHQHFGRQLAEQFLRIDARWENGITHDPHHPERAIRGITYDQARQMDWAYVVATVQDNQQGFARFARSKGAKYVLQVGNTNQQIDWDLQPLALVSSEVPIRGKGVRYHQEFDAADTFAFRPPLRTRSVASFVNCFGSMAVYHHWLTAQKLAPEWLFGEHGIDGKDGIVEPVSRIAGQMAASDFGWHDKEHGDGFGFVVHYWAAIGRPLIGHRSHYLGKLAEPFFEDGVTAIDLDRHSLPEAIEQMTGMTDAEHGQMCAAIRARFDALVDYDAEAEQIRELLA